MSRRQRLVGGACVGLAALGLFAAAAAAACASASAPPSADGQWVVSFEDDFVGDSLNATNWNVNNYSATTSIYDGHDALFVADRVAVQGGNLVITTKYEPTTFAGKVFNMTSGWIDTQGKVSQLGGRFEASMKMPDAGAVGAWPAWWLLPVNACWPVAGEVDIVEIWMGQGHYQHNRPGNPISMASTYHYGYSCSDDKEEYSRDSRWFPNMSDTSAPLVDFSADFHTFGVEMNGTALRFYVDNSTSFVYPLPQLCVTDPSFTWGQSPYYPWLPMYGILNVAVAQNSPTEWWQANSSTTTLVDWVRWYTWVPAEAEARVPAVADVARL